MRSFTSFPSSVARLAIALALAAPLPLAAQAPGAPSDPGMAAMHGQWKQVTGFIAKAADQMPEADYTYKPVATVRTFGQLVAHVAGAQGSICAAALGEKERAEDAVESGTMTKAAITAALKETTALCDRAYRMSTADAVKSTMLFGSSMKRMDAIALNAVHNGEHYGNIITYMRMKGMVPPSSQR